MELRLFVLLASLSGTVLCWRQSSADEISKAQTFKYEEPRNLTGTVYSADRKNIMFKFTRRSVRNGGRLDVFRSFTYPDGRIALNEKVVYEGDNLLEYDADDLQPGARGSAKVISLASEPARKVISFAYTKDPHSGSKPKIRTEPFQQNCLVSDMIAPFLTDHWTELLNGAEVRFRFIVLDRKETVGFTFLKVSETRRDGRDLITVKMFPTSRIISVLVDPLFFTIEKSGQRRVLEYSGRTTLKIKDGNKWKEFDGVTVFEW